MWKKVSAARQIITIVRRQANTPTPETRLLLAVIEQAVSDCFSQSAQAHHRDDAERYLFSKRVEPFAAAIDLDVSFLRGLIQTARRAALT